MNGSDDKDNLVNLTAREHFIAHILLVKIYPEEKGLINAVNMMTVKGDTHKRVHNRMYGWLKEKFSERMSELQTGSNNSQYGTIWICNLKSKSNKKIKESNFFLYEKEWIKGRNKWKEAEKKAEVIKNKNERKKDTYYKYLSLFNEYKKSNKSLNTFCKDKQLKRTTVLMYWKRNKIK